MSITGRIDQRGRWLPAYLMINAALSALPVLYSVEWPSATDARLFVAVALTAQLGLAMLICGLPGLLLDAVRPLRACAPASVAAMTTLWWIALLVDARVFQQFGFHLNGLVIVLMLEGGLLGQLGLTPGLWTALAAGAVGMAAAQWALARHLRRAVGTHLRRRWLVLVLPLVVVTQAQSIWYDAHGRADAMVGLRAIPWMHTATARRNLIDRGWAPELAKTDWATADAAAGSDLSYPRRPLQCDAQRPLNVLMIVVDSLRYDMLSSEQMPHTFRFATSAWRGDQHYSTGNNTMHGLFGLFYGLPALHTNTMIRHRRGPELLRQLQRQGYAMHLYGGASLQGARLDRAVFVETDAALHTASPHTAKDRRDREVTHRMAAALRAQPAGQPFFGFMLLDSAHAPYAVPDSAEQRFQPQSVAGAHIKAGRSTDPGPLFNRYRNAVLKADTLVGQLLQTLEASGHRDDTVVIITSDHGESFNDLGQNDWGHNSNFSDVQTRVPMLIRWPGRSPMAESAVTSHMDIAPTLLRHLLSCSNPPGDHAAGLDLFSALPATRPLLVESWTSRAVRMGAETLLLRPYGIEVRDAAYRPVEGARVAPSASAAVLEQMQLLQPESLQNPGMPVEPTG